MSATSPAIRIAGVSRYFGAPLEMDGAERPGPAMRSLLRIAGLNRPASGDDVQATVAAPGWVLRDITLDIAPGTVTCLTGPSGAGKSLLLQIIAGTIPPTTGRIEIYGSMATLLATGQPLNPRLSTRENIHASPVVAGATADEISRYTDDVIAFAELQGFEDVAVRTFSTGMIVRLNMALALCASPAIVLVDDVLGVGDIAFQQKCVERLDALRASGCAMVLAFSDEGLIQQLATRIVTLTGGRIVHDSAAHEAFARDSGNVAADVEWQLSAELPEDEVIAFRAVAVERMDSGDSADLAVTFEVAAKPESIRVRPGITLWNDSGVTLFRSLYPDFVWISGAGQTFTVRVPTQLLTGGHYRIGLSVNSFHEERTFSTKSNDAVLLTIRRDAAASDGEEDAAPMLQPSLSWTVERMLVQEAAAVS